MQCIKIPVTAVQFCHAKTSRVWESGNPIPEYMLKVVGDFIAENYTIIFPPGQGLRDEIYHEEARRLFAGEDVFMMPEDERQVILEMGKEKASAVLGVIL
jgi:hypothetical protein